MLQGFNSVSLFSSKVGPRIYLRAKLTGSDGRVWWRRYSMVLAQDSGAPPYKIAEYLQDPERIREAFTIVSRVAAKALVNHMAGAQE